jgi:2-oxoglutarate dehydrogenase E1 component
MNDFSYITNSHPEYIENLYRDFVKDPSTVDPEMKKFFEGFDFAVANVSSKAPSNGSVNGTAVSTEKKASASS